jgi:transcriptional regulator with XRE-family HTH domain
MVQSIDPETANALLRFSQNLREIRERVGPHQRHLAALTGVDRSAISLFESAKQTPKFSTLLKLARGAEVKVADFFEGIGPVGVPVETPVLTGTTATAPAEMFGANLTWARERSGLTIEQLALEAEVDRSTIGKIEKGELEPSLPKILKLARALEIPPATLFHGVE